MNQHAVHVKLVKTCQDSSLPLLQSHQPCVDDRWCNAPPVFASRPWERQHPWPQSVCDGTNQRIFSHVNTAIYSINNNFHRPEGIVVVLLWSLGCFFWFWKTWNDVDQSWAKAAKALQRCSAFKRLGSCFFSKRSRRRRTRCLWWPVESKTELDVASAEKHHKQSQSKEGNLCRKVWEKRRKLGRRYGTNHGLILPWHPGKLNVVVPKHRPALLQLATACWMWWQAIAHCTLRVMKTKKSYDILSLKGKRKSIDVQQTLVTYSTTTVQWCTVYWFRSFEVYAERWTWTGPGLCRLSRDSSLQAPSKTVRRACQAEFKQTDFEGRIG